MSKQVEYDWGELKVIVEEVRVFDTKNNKFIANLATARVEEVDFEKLTNDIIKREYNVQVPFAIKFTNKW